jgi:hypothetical protein
MLNSDLKNVDICQNINPICTRDAFLDFIESKMKKRKKKEKKL